MSLLNTFASRTFQGSAKDTFNCGTFTGTSEPVLAGGCTPTDFVSLDTSTDDAVWDNVSDISFASVSKTDDALTCIMRAHRHAIGRKELAVSNGVYVPEDTIWRLPRRSMGTVVPKVRDRITDVENVVWTILEVSRIAATQRYRCVCRDLILVENLRDSILIETPSYTFDTAGIRIKTFTSKYAGLPARVQPITSEIVDERAIRGFKTTHTVIVDRQLSVTNEDRIVLENGRILEIRGYRDPERIDELPQIDAELVP